MGCQNGILGDVELLGWFSESLTKERWLSAEKEEHWRTKSCPQATSCSLALA